MAPVAIHRCNHRAEAKPFEVGGGCSSHFRLDRVGVKLPCFCDRAAAVDDVISQVQGKEVGSLFVARRFATKLGRIFGGEASFRNLHVLVSGEDDLAQIRTSAATYVTRMTRRALGRVALLERLIPEAHVFSHDSSRELLSFIVQKNLHDRAGAMV